MRRMRVPALPQAVSSGMFSLVGRSLALATFCVYFQTARPRLHPPVYSVRLCNLDN